MAGGNDSGSRYLAALIAVQWPFGSFMISPLARNWFFGMNYFGYFMRPQDYHFAWQFEARAATRGRFWLGLLIALITATSRRASVSLWAACYAACSASGA